MHQTQLFQEKQISRNKDLFADSLKEKLRNLQPEKKKKGWINREKTWTEGKKKEFKASISSHCGWLISYTKLIHKKHLPLNVLINVD